MSINKTDIFNIALSNLGEHTISDSSTSSTEKASVICNRYYDLCLKTIMKEVDWPFIATQKKLTQNTLTKTEGGETIEIEFNKDYPFVFDIPNDCVSIEKIFIGELNSDMPDGKYVAGQYKHYKELMKGVDWKFYYIPQKDATKIVCRYKDNINAEYTKFAQDTLDYQPYFADALAWLLSTRIAIPITKDSQKVSMCLQMYQETLKNAKMLILNEQGQNSPRFTPAAIKARIHDGVKHFR